MLQPKRQKFRKAHKGRIHGRAQRGTRLAFGLVGLMACSSERLTARQIEAARRSIVNFMKRSGRVFIRIFPDIPVTKKPIEVRMGKGKGSPEYHVARVKAGTILFEVANDDVQLARQALVRGSAKLPVCCKVVGATVEGDVLTPLAHSSV